MQTSHTAIEPLLELSDASLENPTFKSAPTDLMPQIASYTKPCLENQSSAHSHSTPRYEAKIIYSEIVRSPQFYLDTEGFFAEATSFILTGENLYYLIGLLNSKLISFAFKSFYAGGGLGESGYRYKKAFIERLPIPRIDSKKEDEFIAIIKQILESKKQDLNANTDALESKLDSLIYGLYDLSDSEINFIQSEFNGGGGDSPSSTKHSGI